MEIYRANRLRFFDAPLQARASRKLFSLSDDGITSVGTAGVDLARYGVCIQPACIHVLVPSDVLKSNRSNVCCHVWSGSVTAGMFIELEPGVYIVSPEFLYLQLAVGMPKPLLAELGMELCGCYEVDPYAGLDRPRPKPLTNPAKLMRFLQKHNGEYGVAKAMKMLAHVIANSWSPMETVLCLLLCLPRTMGGYGIPKPSMNTRVELSVHAQPIDGRHHLFCDFYWHVACFALEYDGGNSHFERMDVIRDNRRLAALMVLGIDVMVLTSADVFNCEAMDNAAEKIVRKLALSQREPSRKMIEKKRELRRMLLLRNRF